ncbi:MAG: DUF5717 family protein [bacterium]
MSKREEFVNFIEAQKAISPTITDQQRKGLLRLAKREYGLATDEAMQIIKDSGLVIGELVNYFEVLGFSVDEFDGLSESSIAEKVDNAYNKLNKKSTDAGARPRPDGRTEAQWRNVLVKARDTLKDKSQRSEHLAALRYEEELIKEPVAGFQPFHFRSGAVANSLSDLVMQIDPYWKDGKYHLYQGDLANWLGSIGRADIASKARNVVSSESDQDIGLEKFLQSLGSDAPSAPKPNVSPTKLDFGSIERGTSKHLSFTITNSTRGHLVGTLTCSASGVTLSESSFAIHHGDSKTISVTVDTQSLRGKKQYQESIKISTNGGNLTIPLEYYISAPTWQFLKPILICGIIGAVLFPLVYSIPLTLVISADIGVFVVPIWLGIKEGKDAGCGAFVLMFIIATVIATSIIFMYIKLTGTEDFGFEDILDIQTRLIAAIGGYSVAIAIGGGGGSLVGLIIGLRKIGRL